MVLNIGKSNCTSKKKYFFLWSFHTIFGNLLDIFEIMEYNNKMHIIAFNGISASEFYY